jgi:hypothetical protein
VGLKVFHVFFIVLSTALTLGFGLWGLEHFSGPAYASSIVSLVLAPVLVVYGVWFLKKLKKVGGFL